MEFKNFHVINKVTCRVVYSTDDIGEAEDRAVRSARGGGASYAVLQVVASTEEKRVVEITRNTPATLFT